ncbi:MAG: ATP-binding protein, partial [Pseudomonadota bacterium]|nr:ATP-binding protein [Pseudomonadota bacterium]
TISITLFLVALPLLAAGILAAELSLPPPLVLVLSAAAATLFAIATAVGVWSMVERRPRLRGEEASTSAALELIPDPAVVTNPDLLVQSGNTRARNLLGHTLPRWLSSSTMIAKSDRAGLRDMSDRALGRRSPISRRLTIDGAPHEVTAHPLSRRSVLWHLTPLGQGPDPAIEAVLPVVTLDNNNKLISWNNRAAVLLGTEPAKQAAIFADLPRHAAGLTLCLGSGRSHGTVMLSPLPGGTQAKRRIALVPLTNPRYAGAEDANWDGFENLPVPLLWLDPGGIVQKANRSAVQLVGDDCLPGARLSDLTEGLGRPLQDWLDEAIHGAKGGSPEFLRVTGAEHEVFVQVLLKPYTIGEETTLLAVLNDATELKTLEAQFVQSQKMHAIGQLAGGVAHDFNNLLTAISGHCDLLLLRHDQGDTEYADLMQINQNANRAAALVNQLLAFSRKQTLRPEEIDLRDTISDLTHLLNRLVGEKITLSFSHDPVLNAIRADKRQLEQVLMNLVVNARDAIRGIGEIRIITESLHFDTAQTRDQASVPPGDYVSVKVIDTGCGIPPDKLTKVFEPFYTTKRVGEGTGLGLSTVYGIIKQTGGYIFADSTVGEGTCFTLLFRASKDAGKSLNQRADPAPQARHADGVVLLVEDEAPVRSFAARALRLRGYTVLEAECGEDALSLLEDAETRVDIFVTDVVMPGMDGPTWVREALKTHADVRVIFMSGYAEEHFGDDQARIPNSIFLPKPFSLAELTQTVQGVP